MNSNFNRFFLLAVVLLFARPAHADSLQGRVVKVTDGDTVTVLDASNSQFKIRLMGIDAPEKRQSFGRRSKESLSALVFNKQVTVEFYKKDRYGRLVGKIVADGVDANLEQIKAGMAWHYKKYQNEQNIDDRLSYAQAEIQAKEARRGLWAESDPTPPWDWRRRKKSKG